MNRFTLNKTLIRMRDRLERGFSRRTAYPGTNWEVPSAGHCAAVATIAHEILGGQLVSTVINGKSHWFNRIQVQGGLYDFDLTGDQFGRSKVRLAKAGNLYKHVRTRSLDQVNQETLRRAELLAARSDYSEAVRKIRATQHRTHDD